MSRRRQPERYWVHSDPETAAQDTSEPTEAAICPGECNAAYRRAERAALAEIADAAAHNEPPDMSIVDHGIKPQPGAPIWCSSCQQTIRAAIGALPELAAHVGERNDGRLSVHAGVDTGPQHTKGSHSPSGSPAWDAVDEAVTWCVDTAHTLALHLGQQWRPRTRLGGDPAGPADMSRASNHLVVWSTSLLQLPKAVDYGKQALSLARRLRRASGRDELTHYLEGPCPECGRRALQRSDGSDTVECRRCGARWPHSSYLLLVQVIADEERQRKAQARKGATQ